MAANRRSRSRQASPTLGVTWFEEPVSSDDLDGLRLLRDRAPAGIEIAAGEYGYDIFYFQRMIEAGAVDVLQADATRCGGLPVSSRPARCVRPLVWNFQPTAPPHCTFTRRARCPISAISSISTTTRASSRCSLTECSVPADGVLRPDLSSHWPGPRIQANRCQALCSLNRQDRRRRNSMMATATATTAAERHRKEVKGPLFIDAGAIANELRQRIRR